MTWKDYYSWDDCWYYKGRWHPKWLSFSRMWPGSGRDWKRWLSKARRRWQDEHHRGLDGIEAECNFKTW